MYHQKFRWQEVDGAQLSVDLRWQGLAAEPWQPGVNIDSGRQEQQDQKFKFIRGYRGKESLEHMLPCSTKEDQHLNKPERKLNQPAVAMERSVSEVLWGTILGNLPWYSVCPFIHTDIVSGNFCFKG